MKFHKIKGLKKQSARRNRKLHITMQAQIMTG